MLNARRVRRLGALLAALVALALGRPAGAWSPAGHMQIALLAYDELPADTRARLTALLESHPRFREDFLPSLPPSLSTDVERARWLFAYAATWPDVARGQPAYDHGTWHYVNLPLELRGSQLVSCAQARRELPASERRIAAIDAARRARGEPGIPSGDSILAALPDNQRTLADPSAPREARALALSWVLHLVGDAHQPLHAVALFTSRRFPSGDRGGNDISVRDRGSLHRVWDGLLGDDASPSGLESALALLRAERARSNASTSCPKFEPGSPRPRCAGEGRVEPGPMGHAALGLPSTLGETPRGLRVSPTRHHAAPQSALDAWIDEDCDLARRAVYVPAVLSAVARLERELAANAGAASDRPPSAAPPVKPELSLRPAYHQHAAEKARQRAVLAGSRLAALLRALPL